MTIYSRRKLLATGAAGGFVAAAAVSAAAAENYSATAMSDPGPHDPAQAAINPYDWQGLPTGTAQMGVFHGEGRNNTVEFHPSDVGYVPQSIGHYVKNVGSDTVRFMEVFTTPQYADISLASWMNNVPHELVSAHLNIPVETLRKLAQSKAPVMPV